VIVELRDNTRSQLFRVGDPMPDYPQLTVTSIELATNGGVIIHQSRGGSLYLAPHYVDWDSVERGNE
jgi:hypothetical protein